MPQMMVVYTFSSVWMFDAHDEFDTHTYQLCAVTLRVREFNMLIVEELYLYWIPMVDGLKQLQQTYIICYLVGLFYIVILQKSMFWYPPTLLWFLVHSGDTEKLCRCLSNHFVRAVVLLPAGVNLITNDTFTTSFDLIDLNWLQLTSANTDKGNILTYKCNLEISLVWTS